MEFFIPHPGKHVISVPGRALLSGVRIVEEKKPNEATVETLAEPELTEAQLEETYPKSWRLAVIVAALCLAVFCMALDNTIIATAIPKITDQFKRLEDIVWYGSAYLVTTCSLQLFFGRLYTFFSIKWVYIIAVSLFEIGSLICGIAPNSVTLIIGRAIAGIGAAGIFSGSIIIVAMTVPLRKRPIYIGFIGSMYGIASVAGPLLGGVFTDRLSWRWCFYINLPFGGVTLAFILFFFRNPVRRHVTGLTLKQKIIRLDLPGTGVLIPAIVCLLLSLQWGGLQYAWGSNEIVALLIIFILLVIAFLAIQAKQGDNGTVPPRVFLRRSVCAASFWAICFGGSFFILVYYVPLWFQSIKGTSATQSGIDSLPLVLAVSLFSVVSGVGITLVGYYVPFLLASSVLMAVGSGLVSTFEVDTGTAKWIVYQIIAGAGYGLGIQIPLITVQASLPSKDVPTGTATIMLAQTLGGALFIGVAQNVFLTGIVREVKKFFPFFSIETLLQSGATDLRGALSGDLLAKVLVAYNEGLQQTYYVATAMAALSIVGAVFVEWKSVKGQFLMGAG